MFFSVWSLLVLSVEFQDPGSRSGEGSVAHLVAVQKLRAFSVDLRKVKMPHGHWKDAYNAENKMPIWVQSSYGYFKLDVNFKVSLNFQKSICNKSSCPTERLQYLVILPLSIMHEKN